MSTGGDALSFATTIMVRDTCLCLHLQRAARAVGRRFDDALRPFGLTNGQFSLLMSLNRPEPPTIGGVAALLAVDRTTLTASLKPLERRGLLMVAVDAADRRSRRLSLTPAGRTLLAAALPVWRHEHAAIDRQFDVGGEDRLRADLRALSETDAGAPLKRPSVGKGPISPPSQPSPLMGEGWEGVTVPQ